MHPEIFLIHGMKACGASRLTKLNVIRHRKAVLNYSGFPISYKVIFISYRYQAIELTWLFNFNCDFVASELFQRLMECFRLHNCHWQRYGCNCYWIQGQTSCFNIWIRMLVKFSSPVWCTGALLLIYYCFPGSKPSVLFATSNFSDSYILGPTTYTKIRCFVYSAVHFFVLFHQILVSFIRVYHSVFFVINGIRRSLKIHFLFWIPFSNTIMLTLVNFRQWTPFTCKT